MNNIYTFLKIVWKELKEENKQNKAFIPFLLLLTTLPISLLINNVFFIFFILTSIIYKNKKFTSHRFSMFLPILLFLWMALSYFWSVDIDRTIKAIPKEIALILLPLMFLFFTSFTTQQKQKIIKYYSYSMVLYVMYFLTRALINFLITKEISYFFYHGPDNETDTGLVPKLLNAIHFSVYVALAFFYFLIKENKNIANYLILTLLFVFVILLSSKNVIVIFILLIFIQLFFYSKIANRLRLKNIFLILLLLSILISFGKIKERFLVEFRTNTEKSLSHNVVLNKEKGVNNVSIIEAWQNESFTHNDYFPGTAFRVYQIRMFFEFLKEEPIFWKGFGLNASLDKLKEKEKKRNLYPGYGTFNFHNQYVQNFAELGLIGFLLLISILFLNINKAFKNKDFMHIAFAVLMISLFLTESFLWRQRGVLFFTVFYCLFNTQNKKEIKI